jgi:hypothetical protein
MVPLIAVLALSPVLHADDWPMMGGRPDRNMVSSEKGLPLEWDAGATTKNIKWSADLGDVTYGSPVISGRRVFIGTTTTSAPLSRACWISFSSV